MAKTKTAVKYYSIMDYDLEAKYLSEMHAKGWKFVKVSFPCIYHFEECEPEKVIYQLDYNPDGIKNKKEYVQMFEDCGWEYLMDFVGYSYFRKPADEMVGEEEIFCDDDSRLDMLKRVFKGRMIPLVAAFFLIIIPNVMGYFTHSFYFEGAEVLAGYFTFLFLLYLLIFGQFAVGYYRLKKRLGR